jgi:glycosyltransferase involved in cell wall biosynthesis
MQTVLHFAQDSDTSGFFPQLGRWHDRTKYRMLFATLNPIAPWLKEFFESQGVKCFSCECESRKDFPLGMLRLARFLRQEKVDIFHAHLYEPSIVGLWAAVLARTPYRVMTRHHSNYLTRMNKNFHIKLDKMCTRLSHRVIAVSEHTAEHLIETEGAPREKIEVVLNGIDFDRVQVSGDDAREKIRKEFDADDSHLILIAARFHPEKGYYYLFDAVPILKEKVKKPFKLLIGGRGGFEKDFRDYVTRLQCDDVVRFLGFRKDIADLMTGVDLFVLPSLAESFGLVLTESIYLGTPVVATRVGGIPEIVEDGVDGILVPPANHEALADTIADLLNNEEKRKALSGNGREKIVQKFQFQEMVRNYERVYQKLVGK